MLSTGTQTVENPEKDPVPEKTSIIAIDPDDLSWDVGENVYGKVQLQISTINHEAIYPNSFSLMFEKKFEYTGQDGIEVLQWIATEVQETRVVIVRIIALSRHTFFEIVNNGQSLIKGNKHYFFNKEGRKFATSSKGECSAQIALTAYRALPAEERKKYIKSAVYNIFPYQSVESIRHYVHSIFSVLKVSDGAVRELEMGVADKLMLY